MSFKCDPFGPNYQVKKFIFHTADREIEECYPNKAFIIIHAGSLKDYLLLRRIEVMENLFQNIANQREKPDWLNENGSINKERYIEYHPSIYHKRLKEEDLPWTLDDNGFIKLNDMELEIIYTEEKDPQEILFPTPILNKRRYDISHSSITVDERPCHHCEDRKVHIAISCSTLVTKILTQGEELTYADMLDRDITLFLFTKDEEFAVLAPYPLARATVVQQIEFIARLFFASPIQMSLYAFKILAKKVSEIFFSIVQSISSVFDVDQSQPSNP